MKLTVALIWIWRPTKDRPQQVEQIALQVGTQFVLYVCVCVF